MATKVKKPIIFITGSEGFIGSHLVKHLEFLAIDHFRYDTKMHYALDINDLITLESAIKASRATVIIHLAAVANLKDVEADPQVGIRTNVIGTYNVLYAAKKYNIPVILASSAATEEPSSSLYAFTKTAMELLAEMSPVATIARFYNVYGKGSKSVVNKFIYNMKRGRKLITYGNTRRDYIHVEDLVHSLLQLVYAKKRPRLVEIGTGRSVTLYKLVSIIEKEMNKKAVIERKPARKEIQESRCTHPYGRYKITVEYGVRSLI